MKLALTSKDKQLRVRERRKTFRFLEVGEKISKWGGTSLFWSKKKKGIKKKGSKCLKKIWAKVYLECHRDKISKPWKK